MFCSMRIVLDEVKDVSIIGIEQANVVVSTQLDREIEALLVLPPLLRRVPEPEIPTMENWT